MLERRSSHFSRIPMASRAGTEQCFFGGAPDEDAGLRQGTVLYRRHASCTVTVVVSQARCSHGEGPENSSSHLLVISPRGHLLPAQFLFSTVKCPSGKTL